MTSGATGSGLSSAGAGARTIAVGAAGNVTGGTQAILLGGTGATSLTNGGIIGTTALPAGLAINETGGGDTTIVNNGTIVGRVTLSGGADALTNNGTIHVDGAMDFGGNAGDTFTNSSTGTFNLNGNVTFVGLASFAPNAGLIVLNSFTLTGPAATLHQFGNDHQHRQRRSGGVHRFHQFRDGNRQSGAGHIHGAAGCLHQQRHGHRRRRHDHHYRPGQLRQRRHAPAFGRRRRRHVADQWRVRRQCRIDPVDRRRRDPGGRAGDQRIGERSNPINVNPVGPITVNTDGILVVDTATTTANAFVLGNNSGNALIRYVIEQRGRGLLSARLAQRGGAGCDRAAQPGDHILAPVVRNLRQLRRRQAQRPRWRDQRPRGLGTGLSRPRQGGRDRQPNPCSVPPSTSTSGSRPTAAA